MIHTLIDFIQILMSASLEHLPAQQTLNVLIPKGALHVSVTMDIYWTHKKIYVKVCSVGILKGMFLSE